MKAEGDSQIHMIAVNQLSLINPRSRGKKKFAEIVSNIERLGLKRPIIVARSEAGNESPKYEVVCGQGRLEAYVALGASEIPALVIEGSKEDLLLMSLAENIARRQHSSLELVRDIRVLKDRGYSHNEIASKTDLTLTYVRGILTLLANGEERLLQAVEKGQIPVSIAITIATSDDKGIQTALTEAYERNVLRGRALLRARRLIESRRSRGKGLRSRQRQTKTDPLSADSLLRTYQAETTRQRMVIQKAKVCERRLLFATTVLRQLFRDRGFVALLKTERLDSIPRFVADQLGIGSPENDDPNPPGLPTSGPSDLARENLACPSDRSEVETVGEV
jgi:ParB family chromosome partitioning protein